MTRTRITRRGALGLIGAAVLTPAMGWAGQAKVLEGRAFGTGWRVVGPSGSGVGRLRPAFTALFGEIDREMSPWRADSRISAFNRAGAGGFKVGQEFIEVTEAALDLAVASEGAFDPTVGPLVARWGFGPINASRSGDWRGLGLGAGRIAKTDAGLTLDLCGIAKGRALDRAAGIARGMGHDSLLLDLGGELVAIGRHTDGRDWRVAIEHPVAGDAPAAVLALPDGLAVATSGLRANSYRMGGRIWGHIIDPSNAEPADGKLRSVTVVAADAMTADGWATALFAAGPTRQLELARQMDIAAVFLFEEGGTLRQVTTGGVETLLV